MAGTMEEGLCFVCRKRGNATPRTAPDHGAELLGLLEILRHNTRSVANSSRIDRAHDLAEALIADLTAERQAHAEAEGELRSSGAEAAQWKERAERARERLVDVGHAPTCERVVMHTMHCDCGLAAALADDPTKVD